MENKLNNTIEITCPHCGTKQQVSREQWFGGAVKQCKRCIASIRDELKIHECKTYYAEIDNHEIAIQIRNRKIIYWHINPKLIETTYKTKKNELGNTSILTMQDPPYTEDEIKTRVTTQLRRQKVID